MSYYSSLIEEEYAEIRETDPFFHQYLPLILNVAKNYIENDYSNIPDCPFEDIRADAISFAFSYLASLRLKKETETDARKVWMSTVKIKTRDYLYRQYSEKYTVYIDGQARKEKRIDKVSLHEPVPGLVEEDNKTYEDYIPDAAPTPEESLIQKEEEEMQAQLIHEILDFIPQQYYMHNYSNKISQEQHEAIFSDVILSKIEDEDVEIKSIWNSYEGVKHDTISSRWHVLKTDIRDLFSDRFYECIQSV